MITYEIIDSNGRRIELIQAESERQALCLYLMNHEELTDVVLWKSVDYRRSWRSSRVSSGRCRIILKEG